MNQINARFVDNQRQRTRRTVGAVSKYVLLIALSVIQIFPLVWLIDFSLASSNELFTTGLLIWPQKFRWDNYEQAIHQGNVIKYFFNSLLINTLAVIIVIVFGIMVAYACTRMKWKLNPIVRNLILLGMMIPIHATLIPNFLIYNTLKITDTIWALLLPYVAFSLPQALFLFCGFMESIPRELEEAAVMDGCGIYRIVWRIIAPLMKSSIATVAIMTYLNNWNEFMMATVYLQSKTWRTLPYSIVELTGQYSSNYAVHFAVMALSAFPIVIIYIILNKRIIKGVTEGSVKG